MTIPTDEMFVCLCCCFNKSNTDNIFEVDLLIFAYKQVSATSLASTASRMISIHPSNVA